MTCTQFYVPGPGAYQFKPAVGEGPKVGMRTKHKQFMSSSIYNPGPGTYDPKTQIVLDQGPSAGIGYGTRNKHLVQNVDVPGPGNYAIQTSSVGFKDAPKYGYNLLFTIL